MIAIALACAPRLLLADEPTTGLDVTVQAQILDLLSQLQRDRNMAMILVTHDLGVVATRTDEIIVMYAGNVVERAPTSVLFKSMAMPYTEALLKSIPRIANPSHSRLVAIEGRPPDLIHPPAGCPFSPRCPYAQEKCHREKPPLVEAAPGHTYACWYPLTDANRSVRPGGAPGGDGMTDTAVERPAVDTEPLLSVEDLHVLFQKGNTTVQAVAGVSFTMRDGETLGLVGESGCGKSTTGRAIVQVEKPTSGKIRFGDTELTALSRSDLRTLRTQVQMIFQDPISSLNPRRRVTDIVAEPLTIWKIGSKDERRETVNAMLERVGIDPYLNGSRRPREFSGGQCQRISIARALVLRAQAPGVRRDRLGPRRVGPGPDPQPARGPQARVPPDHPLHRARPGRGQERQRPGGGHVPGPPLRDRALRPPLRNAGPPLHRGAPRLGGRAGPRGDPGVGAPHGRAAQPDQPAVGLPLPDPLPAGRGPLRRGGPRAAGDRAGPHGGLPLPDRELNAPREWQRHAHDLG